MKTIKNYLYNLSFQIVSIILPIITTPYISRVLQVDGVGQYSVSVSICNYFFLFGMLGFTSYGSRQIAYVRNDINERIQTFWEINNVKFITMLTSILIYMFFVILYIPKDCHLLYFAQSFTLVASLFDITWYFVGMENFKKTAIRNIIVRIVSVVLIFSFVKSRNDVVLYAGIISISALVGQLVLWKDIRLFEEFCWRKNRKGKTLYHLKRTIGLWLPALAINVFTSMDKIMLGYMSGDSQVGLYESSDKIVRIAITTVTTFATVMVPKMSNLFANNNTNQFKLLIDKSLSFVIMLSVPMTFGIIGIANTIVPWFFGSGFEETTYLLYISAWLAIILGIASVFGNEVLISLNREKEYTIAVFIAAFFAIILNLVLIPKYAAYGAVMATVASETISLGIMIYFAREMCTWHLFFRNFLRYFISATMMCAIVYHIGIIFEATIMTTFIQVIIGFLVYICLLFLFKDENIKIGLNILKKKFMRSN